MKVAYFTSRYPAISHTFIMREILALRARGIEVVTISQRAADQREILAEADRRERDATSYILPPRWGRLFAAHLRALLTRPLRYISALVFSQRVRPGGLRAMVWHFFYFVEAVQLADEMRRRNVRHVHVHFAGPCATVAMIAERLGDLTYSMTVHGPIVFFDVGANLLREKVERAAFIICISDFARSQLAAHVDPRHWSKMHIIHCGVDTTRYHCDTPRPRSCHLLSVGRLVPVKNASALIEAVARLADEFPDIRCTLVGDGPERARFERLAADLGVADRVTFAGAVGQDDILDYYRAADVFVLPSFAEGVPVVYMEAMAMGLPTIGTAVGGTTELIEHGESGLIVPPGNLDKLVEALRRVLSDDALCARLSAGGRRKVVAEFEISRIGAQVADLFARQLGGAPPESGRPGAERKGEFAHVGRA